MFVAEQGGSFTIQFCGRNLYSIKIILSKYDPNIIIFVDIKTRKVLAWNHYKDRRLVIPHKITKLDDTWVMNLTLTELSLYDNKKEFEYVFTTKDGAEHKGKQMITVNCEYI